MVIPERPEEPHEPKCCAPVNENVAREGEETHSCDVCQL